MIAPTLCCHSATHIYRRDSHHGTLQSGHLEVLQWAQANGCPWDYECAERAAMNGAVAGGAVTRPHD
jgi:hypothetical protein